MVSNKNIWHLSSVKMDGQRVCSTSVTILSRDNVNQVKWRQRLQVRKYGTHMNFRNSTHWHLDLQKNEFQYILQWSFLWRKTLASPLFPLQHRLLVISGLQFGVFRKKLHLYIWIIIIKVIYTQGRTVISESGDKIVDSQTRDRL